MSLHGYRTTLAISATAAAAVLAALVLGAADFYNDTSVRLSVLESGVESELRDINARLDRIERKLDAMQDAAGKANVTAGR